MKRLLGLIVVWWVPLSAGCSLGPMPPTEVRAALDAAEMAVEARVGPLVTWVAGPKLDQVSAGLLMSAQTATRFEDMPKHPDFSLLSGYFVVNELRIDRSKGILSGQIGPVRALGEGLMSRGCGALVDLELLRSRGSWTATVKRMTVC